MSSQFKEQKTFGRCIFTANIFPCTAADNDTSDLLTLQTCTSSLEQQSKRLGSASDFGTQQLHMRRKTKLRFHAVHLKPVCLQNFTPSITASVQLKPKTNSCNPPVFCLVELDQRVYCFFLLSRGKQSLNILLKMRKRRESFCQTGFDPLYLSKQPYSLL